MDNKFYNNYYTNNPTFFNIKELTKNYKFGFSLLKNNIGKNINNLSKDIKILEIGSGMGTFANYCNKLGFKNYIGFELDKNIVLRTQKQFPNYKFYDTDVFDFLQSKKNTFDVVFISHVFEHLGEDNAYRISQLINKTLKQGGVWINTMPNADAPYVSQRYSDITHKYIYSSDAFTQLLIETGFKKDKIIHKEQLIGKNIMIQKILSILKIFHKVFLLSAGIYPPKIFTPNFFTIAKK